MLTGFSKTQYFTGALLVGGGILIAYLCFRIFQPFLGPVVWATVLALLLHPAYEPVVRVVRSRSAAAMALCVMAALLLGVPFFYLIASLPAELSEAYGKIEEQLTEAAADLGLDLPQAAANLLQKVGPAVLARTPRVIGEVVEYLFDFALTYLTLFFFLRDGERLVHWMRGLIPLREEQTHDLFAKIREVVRATVLGGLAVALAQGTLGGLLFRVLGLPTPLLWGVLMGALSLVPPLGAWLIWLPAVGILISQGSIAKGVILLLGGVFGVSVVDNILRPVIIGQRTQLPTLMIFFSLLGGLQFFGPVGVIIGPVLVALLIGILDFTRERVREMSGA